MAGISVFVGADRRGLLGRQLDRLQILGQRLLEPALRLLPAAELVQRLLALDGVARERKRVLMHGGVEGVAEHVAHEVAGGGQREALEAALHPIERLKRRALSDRRGLARFTHDCVIDDRVLAAAADRLGLAGGLLAGGLHRGALHATLDRLAGRGAGRLVASAGLGGHLEVGDLLQLAAADAVDALAFLLERLELAPAHVARELGAELLHDLGVEIALPGRSGDGRAVAAERLAHI
jgi:hypothetical protein